MQTSGQIACLLKAKECDFWTWFCGSFYLSTYGNRETYRKSLFENLLLRMLLTSCVWGPAINRISAISLQSLDYGINVWFLFKFHSLNWPFVVTRETRKLASGCCTWPACPSCAALLLMPLRRRPSATWAASSNLAWKLASLHIFQLLQVAHSSSAHRPPPTTAAPSS